MSSYRVLVVQCLHFLECQYESRTRWLHSILYLKLKATEREKKWITKSDSRVCKPTSRFVTLNEKPIALQSCDCDTESVNLTCSIFVCHIVDFVCYNYIYVFVYYFFIFLTNFWCWYTLLAKNTAGLLL